MRDEITAAVVFLARLIEKSENFDNDQLEMFKRSLSDLLAERFQNHWFPERPDKGQGYRCIRVNGVSRKDPTLEKAAIACGFKYEDMNLPCELTVWVDPNEVCCRFGETKGSFCTLASFSDKESSSGSEESLTEDTPQKLNLTPTKESSLSPQGQKSNSGPRNRTNVRRSLHSSYPRAIPQQPKQLQHSSWYNVFSPQWLSPSSSPPFLQHTSHQSMIRSQKWMPHATRYHAHKSTVKV